MKQDPTVQLWRIRALGVLQRVTSATQRFSASSMLNRATMLAAADELDAATKDATVWFNAHPDPDAKAGAHVVLMLKTCAEVAVTAQWAATEPSVDFMAAMGRLEDLLSLIEFYSRALDGW